MNDQAIRDLLARAADGAGEEFRLPSVEQFRARRRHRRRTVAASVASVAVVGVVAALSVTLTGG